MYGRCQVSESGTPLLREKYNCTNSATHRVQFNGQPYDPMYVCPEHAKAYRQQSHQVEKL